MTEWIFFDVSHSCIPRISANPSECILDIIKDNIPTLPLAVLGVGNEVIKNMNLVHGLLELNS